MPSPAPPDSPASPGRARALAEVAAIFLRLGLTSFGGPIAHLGYFRAELVERRRWLDDARYADLVALCQLLPGPASSQVVFALGRLRAGLAGALIASLCFLAPSAILMIGLAYGLAAAGDVRGAGWLHGLLLAAVAVVAQAVWGMGQKLCPDRARTSICLGAAAALLVRPGAIGQLGAIAGGGLLGWWLYRDAPAEATPAAAAAPAAATPGRRLPAAVALAAFAALLVALPALAAATESRPLAVLDGFYRAGALVFGGGHVVLPLLREAVVPAGWLTDDQFLAGYGAAQALPGPLFAFAGYLGAALAPGGPAWAWGAGCLLAIFLPGWLLVEGALPFWHRLRAQAWARAALAGANAAVVGVLLAALWSPLLVEAVRDRRDAAAALVAFGLLERWRAPPWLVVALLAAAGQWLLASPAP